MLSRLVSFFFFLFSFFFVWTAIAPFSHFNYCCTYVVSSLFCLKMLTVSPPVAFNPKTASIAGNMHTACSPQDSGACVIDYTEFEFGLSCLDIPFVDQELMEIMFSDQCFFESCTLRRKWISRLLYYLEILTRSVGTSVYNEIVWLQVK